MSTQLDNVIQQRLQHWLWPRHTAAVSAIIEDTTGWKDLRETLLHTTGDLNNDDVTTALDTTLGALHADDLDWITSDLPEGDGATNPATFLSTLVQDHYEDRLSVD